MNIRIKIFIFLLLVAIFFLAGNTFAKSMKLVSVTVQQVQIPVLKGKNNSPVLHINIETSGREDPLVLRKLELEISGTDINGDIKEICVFYTENKTILEDGIRFGMAEKPQQMIVLPGHQNLVEGTNIFRASFVLNENANILNSLNAKCTSLKIGNKKIIPEVSSEVKSLKMGVALRKHNDDGKTWSNPINITRQVKNEKWHLFLQGPGKGITMQNGTLVFPAQFKDENEIPHSTIIFSKDRGLTWQVGTGAKQNTTEAQVIELNDGSLMLNMRDDLNRENKWETNGRAVMITKDLGETWQEHLTSNGTLIEPNCIASLIKEEFEIDGKLQKVVLFSNPNSKYGREKMTVKISFDDGKTWPDEYNFLVDELTGNGYSCLTKIDDKHLGILYEGSQADLVFQQISIDEIIQRHKFNWVFKSGTEGYKTFRIPSIVTAKTGKILAFAEGRVNDSSDTGNIDLVMKSSDDAGKTWSPLKVIWNDNENVCGNPAPVVDSETGEIHLLMTWNLGEDHEREIIDGKSKNTRRVFISSSINEGESWSVPREITSTTKLNNWTWYATGPCHGIQLKNGEFSGRLVIPCDHIEAGSKKYYSHIIYSDDHGKSWKLGGRTPQDQVNECTVAELQNGQLLLNMRNYDRTQKSRKVSWSNDGGISWTDIQPDTALVEPICQASLIFREENQTLYFLNPTSSDSRVNMTLKASKDSGKTWETLQVLNSGASAYSDLTLINKNTLGCLYEGGRFSAYEGINFTTVNIE